MVGVQRKEVKDLISSVQSDDRLHREVQQIQRCKMAFLVVEGKPRWTVDGWLVHDYARWSRTQHRSLLRSVQMRGIYVEFADNMTETVALVEEIAKWCSKGEHLSLDRRTNPGPDDWGTISDKGWASHLLQSVPGVGPKQATLIWDHFEGKVPIGLTVGEEELSKVKGLGPKRVAALVKAFPAK